MSEKTAKAKRREQTEGMVKIKCVFSPCTNPVLVKAPPEGVTIGSPQHMASLGGIPMCPQHGEWLAFYIWCQMNIKLETQKTPGGLITPGHQQFKPTMEQGAKP
ncbi:MAG: hypothetical protein KAS32_05140 [Candidatus Peribacteraceae bacterium]|nr:hypothetical protein [Candidatus Peribacteraceae bacterium]